VHRKTNSIVSPTEVYEKKNLFNQKNWKMFSKSFNTTMQVYFFFETSYFTVKREETNNNFVLSIWLNISWTFSPNMSETNLLNFHGNRSDDAKPFLLSSPMRLCNKIRFSFDWSQMSIFFSHFRRSMNVQFCADMANAQSAQNKEPVVFELGDPPSQVDTIYDKKLRIKNMIN
jgi:hypothetical protein